MEIGSSTLYGLLTKTPLQASRELARHDVKALELVYEYPQYTFFDSAEVRGLKKLARKHGITYSMHCPYVNAAYAYLDPRFSKPAVELVEKSLNTAARLGATHYVMHGGRLPRTYRMVERGKRHMEFIKLFAKKFKPIFSRAERRGVRVVAENLNPGSTFGTLSDLWFVKKTLGMGLCLDIAHTELFFRKQKRALLELGVDYVHASDNHLKRDEHLRVGRGKIDFKKWFCDLKATGFDGKVIVECTSFADCVNSMKKLKTLL